MIAPGSIASLPALITYSMERRGAAFLRGIAATCREWPELRKWLFEDFGRDPRVRKNFNAMVDAPANQGNRAGRDLAEVAGEACAWRIEKAKLERAIGRDSAGIYGGRTWQEIEQLVFRYVGGVSDLGVLVFASHWLNTGSRARFAPELHQAGVVLLDEVIRGGNTQLLANLARAVALLKRRKNDDLRASLGHADWWKLQMALYILQNPKPAYRSRDVRCYLSEMGIVISPLDFRRFCNRHGIRRDMRAGRPRG